MQRIDGPTVSAALPAPRATGTGASAPGFFTRGDPIAGTPPTTLDADWANMIQEELLAPVLAAGLTPDKADHGQLLAALRVLFVAAAGAGGAGGSSLGPTGHRISADGYMEQWGYVPGAIGSETTVTVTFPVPFPTECFDVTGHVIDSTASVTGNTQLQEVAISTTQATLAVQDQSATFSDAAGGYRWSARGH
ncbi:gp53-like domain-containing protein [Sphingomonas bacterium]|uniref:gp53-like domain-containing protein n=1 Tax=Sphingomonas bacterium TaxID=1895847 RepID=UPI001576E611|nr:hypothetical protein [Sphingomonas bacterium]